MKKTLKYLLLIQLAFVMSSLVMPVKADAQMYSAMGVYCSPNTTSISTNGRVEWHATAYGGNGFYSYAWTGTDGFTGNSDVVVTSYPTEGTKTAYVTARSSNGQTVTANCGTVSVFNPQPTYSYYPYYNYPLSGSCFVSANNVQNGFPVTWSATASGGNGFYTFSWSGDDNLSGSGQSISRVYNYSGTKNATVTIYSNGQTITRNCAVSVGTTNQVLAYNDTNPLSAVYLSDLPYTGAGDTEKMILFVSTLILWSAAVSLYFLKKKQTELTPVLVSTQSTETPKTSSDRELLSDIEAYARSQKVLLSSEAILKIAKMKKLNNVNPNTVISKLSNGEWRAVGESEIK